MTKSSRTNRRAFERATFIPAGQTKASGRIIHFRSRAAKVRLAKKIGCSPDDKYALRAAIPQTEPRDLVQVYVWRGFDARYANGVRGHQRAGTPLVPKRNPNYVTGMRRAYLLEKSARA